VWINFGRQVIYLNIFVAENKNKNKKIKNIYIYMRFVPIWVAIE
jgi:hypothetical protein